MISLRLFIALELNNHIWGKLESVITYLKSCNLPSVRWIPVRNTHLTLKFLGEVSDDKLPEIINMVRETASSFHSLNIAASGIGVFPNIRQPRIIWAGISITEELFRLQKTIETASGKCGFPVETRPYSPHLTLGRFSEHVQTREITRMIQAINRFDSKDLGSVFVETVNLFKSDLRPGGAVYTIVEKAPLMGVKIIS